METLLALLTLWMTLSNAAIAAFVEMLSTPLTPWFKLWSTVGAVSVGATLGGIEGFCVHRLKREPPWPRLFS